MTVSVVYWILRRLVELLVLRRRSDHGKAVEILVLRHELAWSVGRSLGRVARRPTWSLSALAQALPRDR